MKDNGERAYIHTPPPPPPRLPPTTFLEWSVIVVDEDFSTSKGSLFRGLFTLCCRNSVSEQILA